MHFAVVVIQLLYPFLSGNTKSIVVICEQKVWGGSYVNGGPFCSKMLVNSAIKTARVARGLQLKYFTLLKRLHGIAVSAWACSPEDLGSNLA